MVEHQPSKLDTWVRFPSPASMCEAHCACEASANEVGKAGVFTRLVSTERLREVDTEHLISYLQYTGENL